jgi:hypothetical protein
MSACVLTLRFEQYMFLLRVAVFIELNNILVH